MRGLGRTKPATQARCIGGRSRHLRRLRPGSPPDDDRPGGETAMIVRWLDEPARRVAASATTRRGLARLGAGGALAMTLAMGAEPAAARYLFPRKPCAKHKQCCTSQCK